MNIPKKIWTFWDSKKPSPTVEACIKTWRFFNPDYEITVLNKATIDQKLLKLRHNDSPARLSDFVRVTTLAKHGGIWLDASTICLQSFDAWFAKIAKKNPKPDFIGFYIQQLTSKKRYPVIESWAFACPENSLFVNLWKDEFLSINDFETVDDYLDHAKEIGTDFQFIEKYDDANYLAIHISAQKILQGKAKNIRYPRAKNMILFKAEDGPLKYRLKNKGRLSVEKRVARLCKDYKTWSSTPIIKFTGDDRKVLEKDRKLRECVFDRWKIGVMTDLTGIQ